MLRPPEASETLWGGVWRPLGALLGWSGALVEPLNVLLEPSGDLSGRSWSRLEAPLDPSRDLSGRSWSRLEDPWSRPEASGTPRPEEPTSEKAFLVLSFESQPCF